MLDWFIYVQNFIKQKNKPENYLLNCPFFINMPAVLRQKSLNLFLVESNPQGLLNFDGLSILCRFFCCFWNKCLTLESIFILSKVTLTSQFDVPWPSFPSAYFSNIFLCYSSFSPLLHSFQFLYSPYSFSSLLSSEKVFINASAWGTTFHSFVPLNS